MIMEYMGSEVQQHMGCAEAAGHWVMIIFTCGLWYPVYRHRKNTLARTSKFYR